MWEAFVEHIRRFYEAHRQELFTYALVLTGHPEAAEDAVHTAFQNVLHRRRAPRELRPYIFRCVRNAALGDHRQRMREARYSVFAAEDDRPEPDVGPQLDSAWVQSALEALTEDQRETIVLKLYNGLTFQEIADLRRVSVNTAASWYRRGLDKLRELLRKGVPHG